MVQCLLQATQYIYDLNVHTIRKPMITYEQCSPLTVIYHDELSRKRVLIEVTGRTRCSCSAFTLMEFSKSADLV